MTGKIELHSLSSLRMKILWVLDKESSLQKDRFSANEIYNLLVEKYDVNTTYASVYSTLLREVKKNINKSSSGFKLMENGRVELEKHKEKKKQSSTTEPVTHLIEAGKPFSAKTEILEIFKSITGDIFICDPYIDLYTIDTLFRIFKGHGKIKVLTENIKDIPSGSIIRALKDLKSEGVHVEIRVYSASVLHDRYIIDDNHFWYSGNSINHLGKKESLIVLLGEDLKQSMLNSFKARWKVSSIFF